MTKVPVKGANRPILKGFAVTPMKYYTLFWGQACVNPISLFLDVVGFDPFFFRDFFRGGLTTTDREDSLSDEKGFPLVRGGLPPPMLGVW